MKRILRRMRMLTIYHKAEARRSLLEAISLDCQRCWQLATSWLSRYPSCQLPPKTRNLDLELTIVLIQLSPSLMLYCRDAALRCNLRYPQVTSTRRRTTSSTKNKNRIQTVGTAMASPARETALLVSMRINFNKLLFIWNSIPTKPVDSTQRQNRGCHRRWPRQSNAILPSIDRRTRIFQNLRIKDLS